MTKGMIFGYARASKQDQNLEMQLDELEKASCWKIYEEKMSGKKKERPQLDEMLNTLREGDRVVVYKLDRISRSTKHLIELAEHFKERGIEFVSIRDNIDTSTPTGRFFFRMMASIAELERDITVERTMDGLAAARARGRKGGRPKTDPKKIKTALKMYDSKQYSIAEITEAVGISAPTLYRYIEKRVKQ